jgi:cytochrome c oxidase cbb3-type subunit 3
MLRVLQAGAGIANMKNSVIALVLVGMLSIAAAGQLRAQQPPPPPPAPAGQGGGRGAGRGGGRGSGAPAPAPGAGNPTATFPAQQRALAAPEVITRGGTLYGISCRSCHGTDLRGGDMGGPNLLRSGVVLADQHGELIAPIIQGGRRDQGMPAIPMAPDDMTAVAEYLHSIISTARGQGAPPPGPPVVLNILVGNAAAGQAYFQAKCSACHSTSGDLQGIATKAGDPTQLQNLWVSGGTSGRGAPPGGAPGAAPRVTTATVTLPNGQVVEGALRRIDDFVVTLGLADGSERTFRRDDDVPKVEVHDPLDGHRRLLPVLTDKDVHDVTAYLVTLK